jgi:hypothetical protein
MRPYIVQSRGTTCARPNVDEMLGLVLACGLYNKDRTYMGDNRYR